MQLKLHAYRFSNPASRYCPFSAVAPPVYHKQQLLTSAISNIYATGKQHSYRAVALLSYLD